MSHYDHDTLVLLAMGERGVTTDAEAHLADCERCRSEVHELAAVAEIARRVQPGDRPVAPAPEVWARIRDELAGSAPSAGAAGEASQASEASELSQASDTEPAPVSASASRGSGLGWRRVVPLLAAAAVGVVVGGGGMYAMRSSTTTPSVAPSASPAQVAVAALKPFDDPGARGTAVVREASSAQRTVTVSVTGLPTKPGSFYEVWLMDPSNAHLVALGVLDAHGDGTFSVPAGIDLHAYSALDVSLQRMNGSPLHSGDSPVRGEIDA